MNSFIESAKRAVQALQVAVTGNSDYRYRYYDPRKFQGSCDVERKVLSVPVFGNLDEDDDMFVRLINLHELGHAEYTPCNKNPNWIPLKGHLMNVLEDMRIEQNLMNRSMAYSKIIQDGRQVMYKKCIDNFKAGKGIQKVLVALMLDGYGFPLELDAGEQSVYDLIRADFVQWRDIPNMEKKSGYFELERIADEIIKKLQENCPSDEDKEGDDEKKEKKEKKKSKKEKSDSDESDEGEESDDDGEEGDESDSKKKKKSKKSKKSKKDDEESDDEDKDDEDGEDEKESDDKKKDKKKSKKEKESDEDGEESDDEEKSEKKSKKSKKDEEDDGEESEDDEDGDDSDSDESDEEGEKSDSEESGSEESDEEKESGDESDEGEKSEQSDEIDEELRNAIKDALDADDGGDEIAEAISEAMKQIADDSISEDEYIPYTDKDIFATVDGEDVSSYQSSYNSITVAMRQLQMILEKVLMSRKRNSKLSNMERGRFDVRKSYRLTKSISKNVFYKKHIGEDLNTAVSLLIDQSGSMNGSKITNARALAIAFSECLSKIQIPFEVSGFTTANWGAGRVEGFDFSRTITLKIDIFKNFNDKYQAVKGKLGMIKSYKHNVDGEAIKLGVARLMERKEARKVMFVLSDGMPEADMNNDMLNKNLMDEIANARKMGVEVYAIGIQTDSPLRFYGKENTVVVNDIKTLGNEFFRKLTEVLDK